MNRLTTLILVAISAIAGCGPGLPSVVPTPPPGTPDSIHSDMALRPRFYFDGASAKSAGTAFVVADLSGKLYLCTAAHLMEDDAEWRRVRGVTLRHFGKGPIVAKSEGRPASIGKGFSDADASTDLVVWPLAEGANVTPLRLATEDLKRNEWAWVIGEDPDKAGRQYRYRCKVTGAARGGFTLEKYDPFDSRGFSGCPIVNANGDVVGSLLGGNSSVVLASFASSIRARLAAVNIRTKPPSIRPVGDTLKNTPFPTRRDEE